MFDLQMNGIEVYEDDGKIYIEDEQKCTEWDGDLDSAVEEAKRIINEWGDVVNRQGESINYEAAVELMDNEIRERLHSEMAPCSNQDFFTAYENAHEIKYGEEWELSKRNPIW